MGQAYKRVNNKSARRDEPISTRYKFDTSILENVTGTFIALNNLDLSLATVLSIGKQEASSMTYDALYAALSIGIFIQIRSTNFESKQVLYSISGVPTDEADSYNMAVTYHADGAGNPFLDNEEVEVTFFNAATLDASLFTKNADTDLSANAYFLDEDDMASNDPNKVASQQSIKTFVDLNIAGLSPKQTARVATNTFLDDVGVGTWTKSGSGAGKTITAGSVGILTIDGIATLLNDRIYVKDEDGSSTNLTDVDHGIYKVTTVGTAGVAAILTRATDFDGNPVGEVKGGTYAFVLKGTDNKNTGWIIDAVGNIDVDTDSIIIVQFSAFPVGSKVIFNDYIPGVTLNPSTTVTTSGTAVVIAEMTKTFTPADATNKIEVFFRGAFTSNEKADRGGRCAIFIDGVIEAETQDQDYIFDPVVFSGNMVTKWQGTLSAASHTITVRMWTSGDEIIAIENYRSLTVKEIDE